MCVGLIVLYQKFQRIKLDCSHTKWRIAGLSQSRNALSNMMFGIAVEFDTFSSGILWSDCLYDAMACKYDVTGSCCLCPS